MNRPLKSWLAILAAGLALLTTGLAIAHPMAKSFVQIRVLDHAWRLHLRLPADRLEVAFLQAGLVPKPLGDGRPTLTAAGVAAYVQDRIHPRSPNGAAWGVQVLSVDEVPFPTDEWTVEVDLTPPPGPAPESLMLDYEVIVREIATHSAVLTLEQDWARNVLPHKPRLLGTLRAETRQIRIDRVQGSPWPAWTSMVVMGARHILEGADHLLFLITLILTAPLVAENGRWRPVGDARKALWATFARVSAFTVGHSISLLGAALGWLPPGGKIVEALIALSVGISALHALRPIFPRREAWIAGGFGLVHGLAFAETLSALQLSTGQLVAATLGFNLGIELVQLLIVAAVAPVVFVLRRRAAGVWTRWALGAGALVASMVWLYARLA
ncbi:MULTISPECIES: HupE/UreJ family protein [unclassified Caulobacter]|uniref:HupE/UreJ family protein n=1 Tax=unclassified Caulobacter TaxID=2648921 RepID=UPI0013047E1B|nr:MULTISPECIES: HupE/UreJ family protein [unclassified Caulobacter]